MSKYTDIESAKEEARLREQAIKQRAREFMTRFKEAYNVFLERPATRFLPPDEISTQGGTAGEFVLEGSRIKLVFELTVDDATILVPMTFFYSPQTGSYHVNLTGRKGNFDVINVQMIIDILHQEILMFYKRCFPIPDEIDFGLPNAYYWA